MKKLKIEKFFIESATMSLINSGIRLQKEINTSLAKHDLNLNQALIMLAIFFEPEKHIRSNELGYLIPTTKGNISHCTSYLEEMKYIIRKNVAGDLRGYEFSLTAKGSKTCITLVKFFNEIESNCDKKFSSSQLKDFIDITLRI